ncbi:MAG: polysaccharide deacetylase family protein [Kiritimatiellae bacterium]|jgi:peptidoglycan/xylan/chitin deacetylase (PgdA/CDA1 family)|nr:polysaccharide deacetylase family protein [Kiritimatiellia bacterium]
MKKILIVMLSMISCLAFAETKKMDINHAINRVDVDKKVIALTFDDGPDGNCLKYAKLFKDAGAKATFFVKGNNIEKKPEIVKALHEAGMEIGNHSYTHAKQPALGYDKALEETFKTQEIVKKTIGSEPKVYRAPYLSYDASLWKILTEFQLPAINASSSTSDWNKETTAEQIYERAAVNRKAGDIILMHSWRNETLEVMPKIIKTLKDDGFKLVTVSELLAMSKKPLCKDVTVEISADVE